MYINKEKDQNGKYRVCTYPQNEFPEGTFEKRTAFKVHSTPGTIKIVHIKSNSHLFVESRVDDVEKCTLEELGPEWKEIFPGTSEWEKLVPETK
ncbi:hypothetical protein [Candidatus Neptunichlamydia sp. REUL1]|uniref:hypothetical protein n=1 Tax=Candidatus Neptunichlamydia sp. REUL1 TaxID=3064277 RepID=UPI00292E84EA|nr:hypothetical protein [Candidatus Neptunochlamydia sp. REUL1]